MPAADKIIIHGDAWERDYIEGNIAACRGRAWKRVQWTPDAVPSKRPATIPPHDHCEICWWALPDTPDRSQSFGYTDGRGWICTECYDRFIADGTQKT